MYGIDQTSTRIDCSNLMFDLAGGGGYSGIDLSYLEQRWNLIIML